MPDVALLPELERAKVGDVYVQHLGPLKTSDLVLVVGRNNYRKHCSSISGMAMQLHQLGVSVCWYEHKANQHARLRAEAWAKINAAWLDELKRKHPKRGRWAHKAINVYLNAKYPKRHFFFFGDITLDPVPTTEDLRRFVRRLKVDRLFVLAHSAGGIVSSTIANASVIDQIVCFGYPFKHPEKAEEPYRTAHLADLTKPLLIIQGHQDEYGSPQDALRYALSHTIHIEPIESDHNYDAVPDSVFHSLCLKVAAFMGLSNQSS